MLSSKSYKYSYYSVFVSMSSDSRYCYLWNTRTGSVIKVETRLYNALKDGDFSDDLVISNLDSLVKQGFLVDSNLSEFNLVLTKKNRSCFNCSNEFTITIAPTLMCNFKCVYCFEPQVAYETRIMDSDVQNQIITFTNHILTKNKYKRIKLVWFGGEPLLAFEEVIKPLSERIKSLCQEKNVSFTSSIITNGYYLKSSTSETLLEQCNISNFQITFDGTEQEYCKKKHTNKEAYNLVKNNTLDLAKLIKSKNSNSHIDIRLNVDKNNYKSICSFVEEMRKDSRFEPKTVSFYLGRLLPPTDLNNSDYLKLDEFETLQSEFNNKICENKMFFYKPKVCWCTHQTENAICIGPQGELYHCEHDFGDKEKITGNLFYSYYSDYEMNYLTPVIEKKCKECVLFPVCLGGCAAERIKHGTSQCVVSINHAITLVRRQFNCY